MLTFLAVCLSLPVPFVAVVFTPLPMSAAPIKKAASGFEGTDSPLHKIRITLTSRKVKELEKVCEVRHRHTEHTGTRRD